MRKTGLCAFLIFIVTEGAFGHPQQDFFQTFASPRLEFPQGEGFWSQRNPGRYPAWLHAGFQMIFGKEPDTTPLSPLSSCEDLSLAEKLRASPRASLQAQIINDYLVRCGSQIETGVSSRWRNSFEQMRTHLDIEGHPFFHRVVIRLPGGSVLKGLLALKGDRKRRPFVVLRLGIFGNVEEFLPERFLLMQLFEQGPSNVLVVENSSGADFIANNGGVSFGGALEGLQNWNLAKILRDPREPLSAVVGSLHFVGSSLGGHGVLNLASMEALQPDGPRVNSYMAFCPVVKLRETLDNGVRSGFMGKVSDLWVGYRLKALRSRLRALGAEAGATNLERALFFAAQSFAPAPDLGRGLRGWPKPFGDFQASNDFLPRLRVLKSPLLVMATEVDDLVPPALNFHPLEERLRAQGENFGSVLFARGSHCTLPAAYRWSTIARIINASLLATGRYLSRTDAIDVKLQKPFAAETPVSFETLWPAGQSTLTILAQVGEGDVAERVSFLLDWKSLDFQFLSPVLGEPERRMIERWLHQNLRWGLTRGDAGSVLRVSWARAN